MKPSLSDWDHIMGDTSPSRRDFLMSSGSMLGGAWVAINLPAIQAAADYARQAFQNDWAFETLTPEEAAELEAIAAQIIPTDETPGAREAGVIHFHDRALGTFAQGSLGEIRSGLGGLRLMVRAKFPAVDAFSNLEFDDQTALLREIENTDFFSAVRNLTVTGMFANPSYGGNRDEIGWRILGFDSSPTFQPPFGYYDREYTNGREQE